MNPASFFLELNTASEWFVFFCGLQMYKVLGTVVYIAMSADASCRGLISPTDGPVVMEFTQGNHNNRC